MVRSARNRELAAIKAAAQADNSWEAEAARMRQPDTVTKGKDFMPGKKDSPGWVARQWEPPERSSARSGASNVPTSAAEADAKLSALYSSPPVAACSLTAGSTSAAQAAQQSRVTRVSASGSQTARSPTTSAAPKALPAKSKTPELRSKTPPRGRTPSPISGRMATTTARVDSEGRLMLRAKPKFTI